MGLNNAYVDFINADLWGMQLIKFFMGFFSRRMSAVEWVGMFLMQ